MTVVQHEQTAHYDDAELDYRDYWLHRQYEDQAERIAIRRLLGGRQFRHAVDVGGGYGRLSGLLAEYARSVTLVDPSRQQLGFAEVELAGQSRISLQVMEVEALTFPDRSADLVSLIRVLHHLPDPRPAYAAIGRILEPGGLAMIEVANQAHAVNRMRYWSHGRRIPRVPVDLRSPVNRERESIPFVNHHPAVVAEGLAEVGLIVEQRLSVSNLRSAKVKAALPPSLLLGIEQRIQRPLALVTFGPSMMLLARKAG